MSLLLTDTWEALICPHTPPSVRLGRTGENSISLQKTMEVWPGWNNIRIEEESPVSFLPWSDGSRSHKFHVPSLSENQ